ncbi:MAG: hypothetical protein QM656_11470 [Paracoccaceae bacterium]
MRKTIVLLALGTLSLAGCVGGGGNGYASNNGYGYGNGGYSQPANSAAVRTLGGAAAGALISDATGGSKTKGALLGAIIGGGSCAVPGANNCY